MRLIIVRHGETFANEKGIACGQKNNSGLNEVGKLQAKKLAILAELLTYKGKNILIVTHGRTKKTLLSILFAKSPKYQDKINEAAPNTGLSIIDLSDNENPILELLNDGKHLRIKR